MTQHVDYPHEPGRLYDCEACEAECHCEPGTTECVFEGEHIVRNPRDEWLQRLTWELELDEPEEELWTPFYKDPRHRKPRGRRTFWQWIHGYHEMPDGCLVKAYRACPHGWMTRPL